MFRSVSQSTLLRRKRPYRIRRLFDRLGVCFAVAFVLFGLYCYYTFFLDGGGRKLEEKKNQQQKIRLKSVRHSFETGYRYKNNDTQNARLERREAALSNSRSSSTSLEPPVELYTFVFETRKPEKERSL